MDCANIQKLLQTRAALPAEGARHLDGCPACAAMVAAAPHLPIDGAAPASDRALLSATLAAIDDDRGPRARLREQSSAVRLAIATAAALVVPCIVLLASPRADLGGYPRMRLLAELGVLALVWLLAAAITLRPLQRALPSTLRIAATVIVLVAIVALASLPPVHALTDASDGFMWRALSCLAYGTLAAVPTWIALRMLARDAGALGRRTAVLAAAAAAIGVLCVFLHCAISDPRHLWAGHVTIALPLFAWAWWHARAR
ncbi:MAG TPA: hypothetical protein VG755_39925 [Nannocystaceae bacterium]|nr:hypothetical protein [Nannocystaceae bacterium]